MLFQEFRRHDFREALCFKRADVLFDSAAIANFAHEPLANGDIHRRGNEVRLDFHIEKTRQGCRRVIGVQRREQEVAGERRVDRKSCRLDIADLADHNDIGVLAEHAAQSVCK
jgi:hypothetical protein